MSTSPQATLPGPVVVGTDGSPAAGAALLWAADEAARRKATLHVIHVPGRFQGLRRSETAELEAHGSQLCEKAVDKVRSEYPDLEVTTEVRPGRPAAVLVEASDGAGLVVVGARGRGRFAGAVIGSVSQQVTMYARCPVVVVRGTGGAQRGPVVVGVDSASEGARALRFALDHAAALGAPVRVVHAEYVEPPVGAPPGGWHEILAEQAAERAAAVRADVAETVRAYPGVDVEVEITEQHPVAALVELSGDARLLVVASRGLGGFAGLRLGSVSQAVLVGVDVPIAIVPAAAGDPGAAEPEDVAAQA